MEAFEVKGKKSIPNSSRYAERCRTVDQMEFNRNYKYDKPWYCESIYFRRNLILWFHDDKNVRKCFNSWNSNYIFIKNY